jgi:hypothetical protein
MRLFFLNPASRALINVSRLRKCGYDARRIVAQFVETLDKLIVLGDGSPEDEIVGILSHHLDGERTVGIVKSPAPGIPALDHIRDYALNNVRKILFIIDQNDNSLNRFFQLVRERIERTGRVHPAEDLGDDERVRMYSCCLGNNSVDIIVVASGLENLDTPKHEIEDHLLLLAGIETHVKDSKEYWRSLNENERGDVLELLKDRNVFEVVFHQHICGCNYLEI